MVLVFRHGDYLLASWVNARVLMEDVCVYVWMIHKKRNFEGGICPPYISR